jgi:hypothetical protein
MPNVNGPIFIGDGVNLNKPKSADRLVQLYTYFITI